MASNRDKLADLLDWLGQELRKSSKGGECLLRGPTCNWDEATTIGAHVRRAHGGGTGYKPSWASVIDACSDCHLWMGNGNDDTKAPLILDGLLRTIELRRQEGLLP